MEKQTKQGSTKQVILVRTDLAMPKGKLAAQVAHASMACVLEEIERGSIWGDGGLQAWEEAYEDWLNGSFTKVCLKVESLERLDHFLGVAKERGIVTSRIEDSGRTVFKEPTVTCGAIGPWWSDEIDEITGGLRLL